MRIVKIDDDTWVWLKKRVEYLSELPQFGSRTKRVGVSFVYDDDSNILEVS